MNTYEKYGHTLPVVMNSIWQRLPKHYGRSYPADFWIHDKEEIDKLEIGETIIIRLYENGSHIYDSSMKAYLEKDSSSFGGNDCFFVRIRREENRKIDRWANDKEIEEKLFTWKQFTKE